MSSVDEALRERSERAIRDGSRSFAAASRVFERDIRESVHHLYAWCRYCDDCVDEQELGHGTSGPMSSPEPGGASTADRRARLDRLREQTSAVFRRVRANPIRSDEKSSLDDRASAVFAALECVVRRHALPERPCLELLEGFEMDVEGRRYATIDDTLRYAYHVAGVVGVMMAHVMGVRDDATLDRAADLGIAMQLTNIARDVMDDADTGRVYLPESWLRETGVAVARSSSGSTRQPDLPSVAEGPSELARRVAALEHRDGVVEVVRRLLDVADRYYDSGRRGIGALRWRHAWAVASAGFVYGDIGRVVRRRGREAWSSRSRIGMSRKVVGIVIGGLEATRSRVGRRASADPPREGLFDRPRGERAPVSGL